MRHNKLKKCEFCGFNPITESQLDIHHKDGNHKNNDPKNLMTLCANCHRIIGLVDRKDICQQVIYRKITTVKKLYLGRQVSLRRQ